MPKNVDQLKHAIDSGEMGDKVPVSDPAAAPLGTDEEAAGTPPSPRQIEKEFQQTKPSNKPMREHHGILPPELIVVFILVMAFALLYWMTQG